MTTRFHELVAERTLALLDERRARLYPDRTSFYIWPRSDRTVVIFDPTVIDTGKVNDDFIHRLSTRLLGRRVVRTNTRGLFLQVGYEIPPVKAELESLPLDLSRQSTPYHLPIGMTDNGELWRSMLDAISIFVVGVSGMGKSAMLHAFIQALLHGGQTLVYAWDGKDNAEYLRYVGRENFTLFSMGGLQSGLKSLQAIMQERWRILARSGHPNIVAYNQTATEPMLPIALVIDEVAEVDDQEALMRHVKVNRAAGLFPIFATNDPTKSSVIAKSNLQTRISMPVVSAADSVTGLGRTGAQNLPKKPGRGLIQVEGRLVEFQAFHVDYPMPTEDGLKWLEMHVTESGTEPPTPESLPAATQPIDAVAQMAEGIRGRWTPEMRQADVARLLGFPQTGGAYGAKTKAVMAYLITTTTTTTTTQNSPENGVFEAIPA